jgi:transposase InsO family protein
LKATHLHPGDCISTDQLESNAPGGIPVLKGRPSKEFYHACTFFTDHASNKVHITLHNRRISWDNGVYATSQFKSSCELLNQRLNFSGVGAKHQNGVAEQMIGTITHHTRTILLHVMRLWPDIITEDLWPFALKLAVDIHNSTPGSSGLSPDEIFTGQKSNKNRLADFHTFGCPVFVLEASLQDSHKLPKWKSRPRMAVYLGHSPDHATTIP